MTKQRPSRDRPQPGAGTALHRPDRRTDAADQDHRRRGPRTGLDARAAGPLARRRPPGGPPVVALRDGRPAAHLLGLDLRRGRRRPDGVSGFISTAIERFEFFQFVPLNTRVETAVGGDPDAAEGRLYICELRQDRESGRWTNAFGVYHDRYRRAPGPDDTPRWRFVHRRYQSLARTTGRAEVFDFPHHLAPGGLGALPD